VMTGLDQPNTVYSHRISNGFFELLGFRPLLGRMFSAQDYEPGSPRVAILTHKLWMSQFGGDPKVVGRSVAPDNAVYSIVGVMLAGEFQLFASRRPELWVPLQLTPSEKQHRRSEILGALARLRGDVTLQQAQAEIDVIARRIASQHPDTNKDWAT
jgi:putative ABC transport system permease protein